jgi:hypothetical protein
LSDYNTFEKTNVVKATCIIFLLLIQFIVKAQPVFQKVYGLVGDSWGNCVQETKDKGFIISGSTFGVGAGSNDVYLLKIGENGSLKWTKTFGGSGMDYGCSIQQTDDGGFIIGGYTTSFSGTTQGDLYLVKTDSSGQLQWSKTFGGSQDDVGYSVLQANDGGFILVGMTTSFGAGSGDVYMVKVSPKGSLLWAKTYGGSGWDDGRSVQQTKDGGFIITGWTESFGSGGRDIYLIKTNSDGTLQWSKTFGGTGYDIGWSVQQTHDNGFIITGRGDSFGGGVYLVKTDSVGALQWSKTFIAANNLSCCVQQTNDSGFIICGGRSVSTHGDADAYLLKISSNGTFQWSRNFGGTGNQSGAAIRKLDNGGYIIVGEADDSTTGNVLLIRTDSSGNANCNQTDASTTVSSPATIVSFAATQVLTGCNEGTPATEMSSGGGEAEFCSTAAISQDSLLNNNLSIYPNPSSGIVYIRTSMNLKKVIVRDILGVCVLETNLSHAPTRINLHEQPKGIYFVELLLDNRTIIKKLFVE